MKWWLQNYCNFVFIFLFFMGPVIVGCCIALLALRWKGPSYYSNWQKNSNTARKVMAEEHQLFNCQGGWASTSSNLKPNAVPVPVPIILLLKKIPNLLFPSLFLYLPPPQSQRGECLNVDDIHLIRRKKICQSLHEKLKLFYCLIYFCYYL